MESPEHKRARLRGMTKKQVVNEAGYANIGKLCNAQHDLRRPGNRAPSKNMIISAMI